MIEAQPTFFISPRIFGIIKVIDEVRNPEFQSLMRFLIIALYFLTAKGVLSSKNKTLPGIETPLPIKPVINADNILREQDKKKTLSDNDFWTVVEAIEEIAQRIFLS